MTGGSILTLIPARGGSKGVLRKNVRPVAGKPLIAWSIEAARAAQVVGEVYVSTDDPEIADTARAFGAEVLERPAEFAGDKTPMIDVINHALDCLDQPAGRNQHLLLLQPTAPARRAQDIDAAVAQIRASGSDSLISVYCDEDSHPARMYTIEAGRLVKYEDEPAGSLRQDLPKVYHRNGAIYMSRIDFIRTAGRLWSDSPEAFIMPKTRSLNIDDEQDLLVADLLMSHWMGHDAL